MKKLTVLAVSAAISLSACNRTPTNDVKALNVAYDANSQEYVLDWQTSDRSQKVNIIVSNTADGKNGKVISSDVEGTHFEWQSNDEYQRKYFTIKPSNGQVASAASRLLPLEKGRNFRDLGGYLTQDGKTVKWGKLFRSGVLSNLTDKDYEFIDSLNIKTVVDFRNNSERSSEKTDWRASDVKVINKDYSQVMDMKKFAKVLMSPGFNAQQAEVVFAKMYPSIVDQQVENYTKMFDKLAESDDGLLFHCTAGKDRTGVSGVLILTALGVDKETAIEDYLLSQQYLSAEDLFHMPDDMSPEQQQMYSFFSRLPKDVINVFAGVSRPMIEEAIAHMESKSGTILNYIQQELDVSDQELAAIKANFLQ